MTDLALALQPDAVEKAVGRASAFQRAAAAVVAQRVAIVAGGDEPTESLHKMMESELKLQAQVLL